MKLKLIKSGTILLVFVYFSCTFFYCLPKNFISISYAHLFNKFDVLFFQNWGFFTPPPRSNVKLYFDYKKHNETQPFLGLEVTKTLLEGQKSSIINNDKYEILAFQIYGCGTTITNKCIQINSFLKFKYPDSGELWTTKRTFELFNEKGIENPEIVSLVNYSKICLQKLKINNDSIYVKITLVDCPIQRFGKQLNKERYSTPECVPIYISNYLPII